MRIFFLLTIIFLAGLLPAQPATHIPDLATLDAQADSLFRAHNGQVRQLDSLSFLAFKRRVLLERYDRPVYGTSLYNEVFEEYGYMVATAMLPLLHARGFPEAEIFSDELPMGADSPPRTVLYLFARSRLYSIEANRFAGDAAEWPVWLSLLNTALRQLGDSRRMVPMTPWYEWAVFSNPAKFQLFLQSVRW